MTEAEWLACGAGEPPDRMLDMLKHANGCAGNRKLRLFACACCRRYHDLLSTAETRHALETSEKVADRLVQFALMYAARRAIKVLAPRTAAQWASNCAHFTASRIAKEAALSAYSTSREVGRALGESYSTSFGHYAALLLDIVGNPFCPATLSPSWRTDTAVALAQQMYEGREFGAMPILADALQDAGCDNEDVLNHCRDTSLTHVRGCWVVELVLGKE
jgi:hypothetical protein